MDSTFRRERKKPVAEMNVVPYIDVMLVLLVIFMVTAPMLTQGLQVELPKAVTDSISLKNREPIIISIKADGSYWIKHGSGKDKRIKRDAIANRVGDILDTAPEAPVLVNGDHRINYGVVVTLMEQLQQAGVPKVGLLTQATPDAAP